MSVAYFLCAKHHKTSFRNNTSLLLTSIRNDNKVFYNMGTPNQRGIKSFFQLDLGQRQKMNKRMNDPRVVQQFLAEM